MTTLIPIGGALDLDRAGVVWRTFVDRAGRQAGRFVIIPTASALPDAAQRHIDALRAAGVGKHPIGLPLRTRAVDGDRRLRRIAARSGAGTCDRG